MSTKQLRDRYEAAMHAVQSGIAHLIRIVQWPHVTHRVPVDEVGEFFESNGTTRVPKECTLKHLRTGINSAMVDTAALTSLLIDKGVITEEEFFTSLVKAAERERGLYEQRLSTITGAKVTLG